MSGIIGALEAMPAHMFSTAVNSKNSLKEISLVKTYHFETTMLHDLLGELSNKRYTWLCIMAIDCQFCREMKLALENIWERNPGLVFDFWYPKLDENTLNEIVSYFHFSNFPALILIQDGKPVRQWDGYFASGSSVEKEILAEKLVLEATSEVADDFRTQQSDHLNPKSEANFLTTSSDIVKSGFALLPKAEFESRIRACSSCTFSRREKNQLMCKKCGCNMMIKGRFSASKCPVYANW